MLKVYTFDENPFYSTKERKLVLKRANRKGIFIRVTKSKIIIIYPKELRSNSRQVKEAVRVAINRALVKEAWEYLPDRVAKLAREYGFKYNGFGLYNHCDHWGACTSGNEIVLSIQLMRLPDHLIDYVILHEFAHTKNSRHTPEFWRYLDSLCGDSKKLHKELEKYMKYIEEFGNNSWFLS